MDVAIVGAGITGLAAAETLQEHGLRCTVLEREDEIGGLAGSFEVNGVSLERFYHHLFTSDHAMVRLIERLGLEDRLEWLPTTNSYYAGRIYHLSTPLDLLRFTRLGLADRIRLGLLYLRTRGVKDWQPLEGLTAREWLVRMGGEQVYHAVWEPLLRGKFGQHADEVSAVWMWNKLKLRGSSRGARQEERLGYLRGGFGSVLETWQATLQEQGVQIRTACPVSRIIVENGRVAGVMSAGKVERFDLALVTTAPAILAEIAPDLPEDYRRRLLAIKYLANVCLVLQLDRSLSDTYWLNVGDPSIPFTGVIEHTNMQRPERYGGAHLVYLSRYLDADDPAYAMSADELLEAYLPHLQRIFQGFQRSWVKRTWAWRERYTQPLITLHYSQLLLPYHTPIEGLWTSNMSQVYPEDRGMNYAVIGGQRVAQEMLGAMNLL